MSNILAELKSIDPNDLEACMWVARLMKLAVDFTFFTNSLCVYDESGRLTSECEIIDGQSLAATLYPMLVEIAEERKG